MDWQNTTVLMETSSVPDSCCLSSFDGCGKGILTLNENQVKGKRVFLKATANVEPHGPGHGALVSQWTPHGPNLGLSEAKSRLTLSLHEKLILCKNRTPNMHDTEHLYLLDKPDNISEIDKGPMINVFFESGSVLLYLPLKLFW